VKGVISALSVNLIAFQTQSIAKKPNHGGPPRSRTLTSASAAQAWRGVTTSATGIVHLMPRQVRSQAMAMFVGAYVWRYL